MKSLQQPRQSLRRAMRRNRAQAVVEMALFGSLIIFVFGILLSYLQRFNDQQYVQMEAFRRALEKGCTYLGEESDGAGASVQYSLIHSRKHSDISGSFKKGTNQLLSASSNIFWAVPKAEAEPESLIVFKINEDEKTARIGEYIPEEHESADKKGNERQRYWTFESADMSTVTDVAFKEESLKSEDTRGITNERRSELSETMRFVIPYQIKEVDKDDESYERRIESGTLWDVTQHLYRDRDGQYKYSSRVPEDKRVTLRRSQWRTEF